MKHPIDVTEILNSQLESKLVDNCRKFKEEVPYYSKDYKYSNNLTKEGAWTGGFWAGLFWLLYKKSKDKELKRCAKLYDKVFAERQYDTTTHDLGFLFMPSKVTEYRITGNQEARNQSLQAARSLLTRYNQSGGFVQAWGDMDDSDGSGKVIIDTVMNLPLLFWAHKETGNSEFIRIAKSHLRSTQKNLVREDGSTYHMFLFDPSTGEPLKGTTLQGYSEDSCWTRGQAWAIYGFTLAHCIAGEHSYLDTAKKAADYFIDHQPSDRIVPWDFQVTENDVESYSRDSSASAIASSGLYELAKVVNGAKATQYRQEARKILKELANQCFVRNDNREKEGLLTKGCYFKPRNKGVNEHMVWGDYFFLESTMKYINPSWAPCWYPQPNLV